MWDKCSNECASNSNANSVPNFHNPTRNELENGLLKTFEIWHLIIFLSTECTWAPLRRWHAVNVCIQHERRTSGYFGPPSTSEARSASERLPSIPDGSIIILGSFREAGLLRSFHFWKWQITNSCSYFMHACRWVHVCGKCVKWIKAQHHLRSAHVQF